LAREGIGIVAGVVIATVTLLIGAYLNQTLLLKCLAALGVVLTAFVVNFFRDPERAIPEGGEKIISPADGKVIEIVEEKENEFLKAEATRISIFMNVFDVHVNRAPMSGEVRYFRYQKGSFLKAYKSEAADVNEQTIIGIEDGQRRLLFKQIAGLIARRIVCELREGSNVQRGERFGIIKFGSRVDVFLPKNVDIKVALNRKVKSGESILGVFHDEI